MQLLIVKTDGTYSYHWVLNSIFSHRRQVGNQYNLLKTRKDYERIQLFMIYQQLLSFKAIHIAHYKNVRFQALTAASMKMAVF
jgi:hypothetical protein